MSKSVSVETLFLRSEHPYFTCVELLTAELQVLIYDNTVIHLCYVCTLCITISYKW